MPDRVRHDKPFLIKKNHMLKIIDKNLEEVLLVFLLSLMSVLIGVQIIMRYVVGESLTWSEELARYCFIWATYIGVSYAVKVGAHIRVDAVTNMLPVSTRRYVNLFSYFMFIVFAALVMKEGYALSAKIFSFGQASSSLGLPMGYVYMAPTVGFGLVIFRILQKMVEEVQLIRKGDPA
jgi:TRAP-type C4-dicarboxylate transport system permease small subunit